MAEKVHIVLLKPWGLHLAGAALTVDFPIADLLIRNKRAKTAVDKSKPKVKLQSWVKPHG